MIKTKHLFKLNIMYILVVNKYKQNYNGYNPKIVYENIVNFFTNFCFMFYLYTQKTPIDADTFKLIGEM